MSILIDLPGELPEPMGVIEVGEFLNRKKGYEITEADQQMMTFDEEQLVGQFLIAREGIPLEFHRSPGERAPNVQGTQS